MNHHEDFDLRRMSAYEIAHFRDCGGKFHFRRAYGIGEERWRCRKCGWARSGHKSKINIAEIESLRRAIRTLSKAGLIESEPDYRLVAWLPLTAKERRQKARQDREKERAREAKLAEIIASWRN